MAKGNGSRKAIPLLPCTCANLRRASRAVTRLYNDEMQRHDIEVTQFTLLMVLEQAGELSQGKLGQLLALDSTSLTRMLRLLNRRGWIQEKEGEDRRFRLIRLTTAGRSKYQQTVPHWRRAQERLGAELGKRALAQLGGLLAQVTAAVTRG
jgi:DNA-binding MarR family transcriptional regulator